MTPEYKYPPASYEVAISRAEKAELIRLKASRKKENRQVEVRKISRENYKLSGRPYSCHVCGYTNFVEICHIKPVSSFDQDTSATIISHIDNLVALCPNHHKELDKGLITIQSATRDGCDYAYDAETK
jgi:predicted restriction endonuclease